MAILKCKMCGGDLMVEAGMTVAECEYCGTKQTVPNMDSEKKAQLFERASRLLRSCQFDAASGAFAAIAMEYPQEAEAHWGQLLCRYGIEYVDDPATGKKIPTCHRSSFTSFLEEKDFELVMETADPIARKVYRDEAKQIEELRKGIIEVSSQEEPYDIFICYKETDEKGDRTIDSVIAQDVYKELTSNGYRVFFSRISLEDKLGQAYEPYIFAALNSAKVMLAFGTDYEYYNAVWVKNEWSRFLQLIERGEKKVLIPCYKGIDAYDMPKEFSHLQAQDMGKVGAVQDLLHGIEKIIPREKELVKETVVMGAANTAPLLERAFLFLEDGDWENANSFCEQVLNIDPKCAEAYLAKLMVELHVVKKTDLANCAEPFDSSNNYQKVIRFGSAELASELKGYITQINTRNENARLDGIYNNAVSVMNSATSIKDYEDVIRLLKSIPQWKDTAEKIDSCNVKIEELRIKAEKERIERERQAEIKRKQSEANAKRTKKIVAIAAPIICVAIAFVIVLNSIIIPNKKYNDAIVLMDTKQYTKAIAAFEAMEGYKDSGSKIKECEEYLIDLKYQTAINSMEEGRYGEAASVFKNLGDYKDSVAKITECNSLANEQKYNNAIALMESGKYVEATHLFKELNGYKDSITKITKCNRLADEQEYNEAITLIDSKEYIKAYDTLIALDGYKDSREKANSIYDRYKVQKLKAAKKGDVILFGAYEQDNYTSNGKEPIEWIVLEVEDNKALILSNYGLDFKPYNASRVAVTWETCTLRKWLNQDFLNSAFSESEKAIIPTATVSIENTNSSPEKSTQDRVFLLSVTEAEKYSEFSCFATIYADSNRVGKAYVPSTSSPCDWWLRTSGDDNYSAAMVSSYGIFDKGWSVDFGDICVRPAMWIDLSEL